MINVSKLNQIKEEIRDDGAVSITFLREGVEKILAKLEEKIKLFTEEIVLINKQAIEMKEEYSETEKEIKSLNTQLIAGNEKVKVLRIKEKELDEREKNDAELHKILENKRIMLEAKENPTKF